MTKIAILLVATIAIHAVIAGSPVNDDKLNPHVRKAKKTLHDVSGNGIPSIQNVQPDNHEGKHAIASAANEYAHQLQIAVYHLHRAIQHNHEGHDQEVLQQVAHSLSDAAHQVQQVVPGDVAQVKNVLKTSVQQVESEVDKLAQVAHELHQHAKQGQDNVHEEVQDVLQEIVHATQQLQIRGQIQQETYQQTKDNIQHVTNDVSTVIQNINTNDQETAHELAHVAHQLSYYLGRIVHHLQNEVHHHEGEARNVIQQVSLKLSEIRASLDEVVSSHGQSDAQARVNELKNQLKTNVHNVAVQVTRLVQLAQTKNQSSQDDQDVRNVVKNVVANVLAGIYDLHRELQVIVEH